MQHVYYQRHLRKEIDYVEKLIAKTTYRPMIEALKLSRIWLLQELQRYQIAVFKR